MKVVLKNEKHRIVLYFPLWIIKTKVFKKILNDNNISFKSTLNNKLLYKVLKKYIRINGHFTLFSIHSDTKNVKIIM